MYRQQGRRVRAVVGWEEVNGLHPFRSTILAQLRYADRLIGSNQNRMAHLRKDRSLQQNQSLQPRA
jgi:hypothetical protein